MTKCDHAGWGMYPDETGPTPEPAEMTGVCEHNLECPTCKFRVRTFPCEHKFNDAPPIWYRTAVNGPMEVR